MSLILNAVAATFEMLGIFLAAFLAIYLLALLLSPIENHVSKFVWRHTSPAGNPAVTKKATFREFSRKHGK